MTDKNIINAIKKNPIGQDERKAENEKSVRREKVFIFGYLPQRQKALWFFEIELSYFEILAGFRINNIKYSEFESNSAGTLGGDHTALGCQPMVGLSF